MENQKEKIEEQTTKETSNEPNQSHEEKKGAGNFVKWAIIILIVAIVLIFVALTWNKGESQNESVLATVGETEITMEDVQPELEQIKTQYLNQGINIAEEEGMEDMILLQIVQNQINKVILLDYAKKIDLNIEEEKIEEEYQKILTQHGGEEELNTAMEQSQLTEKKLRDDIRNSLIFQSIAKQEGSMEITEEDIQNRYQQLKEQMGDELPPLTEVYDQIEQEIMNEKMGTVLESIIDEVKESYDVEIFIETQPAPPVNQNPETPQGEEMTEEEIMEMLEEQKQETEE